MKRFATIVSLTLIVIEGLLGTIPFLISWWLSAAYRAVLAGWAVSGMESADKRKALHTLLGDE